MGGCCALTIPFCPLAAVILLLICTNLIMLLLLLLLPIIYFCQLLNWCKTWKPPAAPSHMHAVGEGGEGEPPVVYERAACSATR